VVLESYDPLDVFDVVLSPVTDPADSRDREVTCDKIAAGQCVLTRLRRQCLSHADSVSIVTLHNPGGLLLWLAVLMRNGNVCIYVP
jgi:hypothetical protein